LSLDDEGIINEAAVEEDAVRIVVCNERGLFVVRVVDGSVRASARRTHRCPVALAPESVAKGEDIRPHDDVKAGENTLHREPGRELVGMEIEPSPNGVDPMVVIDVRIHRNGICRVDDNIICKRGEVF
jgi:hypothetical protein